MKNDRKEIIQVSGLTILMVMGVVATLLIAGFFIRWHNYQVFRETKLHHRAMTNLWRAEHDVKLEITHLEGAPNWNETAYARVTQGKEE